MALELKFGIGLLIMTENHIDENLNEGSFQDSLDEAQINEKKPPSKKPRWKKWLKRCLVGFTLTLLILICFTLWLINTSSGLHFAATTLPSWFGVNIQTKTLTGTIWKGFDATEIKVKTSAADVTISRINFVWQSSKVWSGTFWVDLLDVGSVDVISKPTEKKEKKPTKLPKNIGLPLDVYIDQIKLEALTLDGQKDKILNNSSISYRYQNNQHDLKITSLNSPWANVDGNINLVNVSPFPLKGRLNTNTNLKAISTTGGIDLSGSLESPVLSGSVTGDELAITLSANPKPFEERTFKKINHLRLTIGGLNPSLFDERAPNIVLSSGILLDITDDGAMGGRIDIANLQPLPINQKGIPARLVQGQLYLDRQGVIKIQNLDAYGLEDGFLDLSGSVDLVNKNLDLKLKIAELQLDDIMNSAYPDKLNGDIKILGNWQVPNLNWHLSTDKLGSTGKLDVVNQKEGQQLNIHDVNIKAKAGGAFNLAGTIDLYGKRLIKLKAVTNALDPATILPSLPKGSINSELNVDGTLAEPMLINGNLNITQSHLSSSTLKGTASVILQKDHLSKANININLGNNSIKTQGSFGSKTDKLNININAPNLKEIGLDLSGSLNLNGSVAGELKSLKVDLTGKADALQYGKLLRVAKLDTTLKFSSDLSAPANIKVNGNKVYILGKTERDNTQIHYIDLNITGTGTKHHIQANTETDLAGNNYKAQITTNGGLSKDYVWKGILQKLDIQGAIDLLLQNPVSLEAGADRFILGKANWSALGGSLQLHNLNWQKNTGFSSKGNAVNLHISKLSKIITLPSQTDNLVLKGDWDVAYNTSMRGHIKIEHQSGDILIPASKSGNKTLPMGIRELLLNARLQNDTVNIDVDGLTKHATLKGDVQLNTHTSTIGGQLRLNIPDLTTFRILVPVGMNIAGSISSDIKLSGKINNPQLNGTLNGNNLLYRERNLGLRLAEGTLRSQFMGQKLLINSLEFKSYNGNKRPSGTLTAKGEIDFENFSPEQFKVNTEVRVDKFNIFEARPNRILAITGVTKLTRSYEAGIGVDGDLKVDFARIDLPKVGTPSLSDDVIDMSQQKAMAEKQLEQEARLQARKDPINAKIKLDLGERFRFQGVGLNVRLGGAITMISRSSGLPNEPVPPPRILGQINVLDGGYRSYGQDLVVDKGIITFKGDLDPVLNIRAKRRYSPVGAGVEVKGPVSAMMITLISDEAMSQKDKLSWLVFGQAPGTEQDKDSLAASAGAWLAGSVNDRVQFFDDLGITTKPKKTLKSGDVSPAEQMAIIGKHLTDTLYVGYEYGLDSSESAVKLSYQLTKTLQLIFRAGTKASSVEGKYSIRFD